MSPLTKIIGITSGNVCNHNGCISNVYNIIERERENERKRWTERFIKCVICKHEIKTHTLDTFLKGEEYVRQDVGMDTRTS